MNDHQLKRLYNLNMDTYRVDICQFLDNLEIKTYEKNEEIIPVGGASKFGLIKSGIVKSLSFSILDRDKALSQGKNRNEIIEEHSHIVNLFGSLFWVGLENINFENSIEHHVACTDVEIALFDPQDYWTFSKEILAAIGFQGTIQNQQSTMIKVHKNRSTTIRALLKLSEIRQFQSFSHTPEIPLTQRELADFLGTSASRLNTILTQLYKEKILEKTGYGGYIVLKPDGLIDYALSIL